MKIPNFKNKKWLGILAGTVLTVFVGVQATVAFLATGTEPITNIFKPMAYKQGQILISKALMHPFGAEYEIPDDIEFEFLLKFESKGSRSTTESALGIRTTDSAYKFRSTGSSYLFNTTESSYKLKTTTPNAYAGFVFETNYGKYKANDAGEFMVTLAPGDTLQIDNIDEGTTVTVTEQPTALEGFSVEGDAIKQIVVSADEFGTIQFINKYEPIHAAYSDFNVYIDKTLTGRAMQKGDSFKFIMEYRDNATGQWHPFASTYVVDKLHANAPDAIFSEYNGLSDFEFVKPGDYAFRVSEVIPEDAEKLKDVTYDTTKSIFVVTVGDKDMDGALEVEKIMPGTDSLDTVEVDRDNKEIIVSFTNTYTKPSGPGGGGGGIIKPTEPEENPKVPGILNGKDHFAYVFGYPDTTVQPMGNITRAEVAAIFYRLLDDDVRAQYLTNTNSFNDTPADAWYITDVSTLAAMNIVAGYPDGGFHPNDPITRAEFTAMASRFDKLTTPSDKVFIDITGHWAEQAILLAVERGWMYGYEDGTIRPDNNITRAEAMAITNRVLCRQPETVDDLLEGMIEWPDNADPTAWYYIDVQEATNGHDYVWKDSSKEHERWTTLDNGEEKQSFLIRLLHLFRDRG